LINLLPIFKLIYMVNTYADHILTVGDESIQSQGVDTYYSYFQRTWTRVFYNTLTEKVIAHTGNHHLEGILSASIEFHAHPNFAGYVCDRLLGECKWVRSDVDTVDLYMFYWVIYDDVTTYSRVEIYS